MSNQITSYRLAFEERKRQILADKKKQEATAPKKPESEKKEN
jgi:hypothetical protein